MIRKVNLTEVRLADHMSHGIASFWFMPIAEDLAGMTHGNSIDHLIARCRRNVGHIRWNSLREEISRCTTTRLMLMPVRVAVVRRKVILIYDEP